MLINFYVPFNFQTELFKNLLSPSGIVKNIGRIIDQKLLMEMNYGGHSSKAGLSSYINLNTALYGK